MPRFSTRSKSKLHTCDERLIKLFNKVVKKFDCQILEGHRGQKAQDEAYNKGNSKVRFPNGKHNRSPSVAVDVAPYPIDWQDRERFIACAYYIKGRASQMGIKLRLGADWNGHMRFTESFFDAPHFELVED